jgi:carbon starvation protein
VLAWLAYRRALRYDRVVVSLPLLAVAVIAVLMVGYRLYGGWAAKQLRLDPAVETPAHRHRDGTDFVPTRPFYLFGQHFSAIAAAGPIAGPILAGQQFGWLPCLLWIVLGVVFIGAIHDLSTLVASVRHEGRSIAEVVRGVMGRRAWLALLAFIWLALVYVIVAFADITAQTFVSGDAEVVGLDLAFNRGGAVALSSVLYLGLAVAMGLVQRFLRPPLWAATLVFVPLVLVAVWTGTEHSQLLVLGGATPARLWGILILVYCLCASVTPVWALLQPRGYLGGFLLYLALLASLIGLFFGGFEVRLPAFMGFEVPGPTGLLFPFLFVTIACGACSGFHGLVCSGTTSKQIDRETHCHPIGYGAMLMEAFVAVAALATLMIAAPEGLQGKGPGAVYAEGLGRFIGVLVGPEHLLVAKTFAAMAFSSFVFDTLDVATRLGRYLLCELFGWTGRAGAIAATGLTCGVPALLLWTAGENAYKVFWTLFGTSNQLLAALSLLGVTLWLRQGGKRALFVLLPMAFLGVVTVTSLGLQIATVLRAAQVDTAAAMNLSVAAALLALASVLFAIGLRRLRSGPSLRPSAPPE